MSCVIITGGTLQIKDEVNRLRHHNEELEAALDSKRVALDAIQGDIRKAKVGACVVMVEHSGNLHHRTLHIILKRTIVN